MTSATDGDATASSLRDTLLSLAANGYASRSKSQKGSTSDLSIDEALVLHSIGWEPVELVCGAAAFSIPAGIWTWTQGEVVAASAAYAGAMGRAAAALQAECRAAGGHGVVGVRVDVTVERHLVNAVMVGSAVAPGGGARPPAMPFLSDLSGRDFTLLHLGGWDPVGLAFGASFVNAPRRSVSAAMRQSSQNVELTNYTEALYAARESAMERMQSMASQLAGHGVVGVRVSEGPVPFARHALRFAAWGTVVKASGRPDELGPVSVVVPLDDAALAFDAASLRGR
ncbi:MAG: heavy metal-binding domain-containing protein [Acidimicrobiales bacterium]